MLHFKKIKNTFFIVQNIQRNEYLNKGPGETKLEVKVL